MDMESENVEVELRAVIRNQAVASEILASCGEWAEAAPEVQLRFLIDYSTFLEGVTHRTRDIRIRSTNGHHEIIVKLGDFAAAGRREAAVAVKGSLDELASVMAFMGFPKGVAALRRIHRFRRGAQEVAVQEVLRFDVPSEIYCHFIEVEQMARSDGVEAAVEDVDRTLSGLGLEKMADEEWYRFIEELNTKANGVFVHGESSLREIEALGL